MRMSSRSRPLSCRPSSMICRAHATRSGLVPMPRQIRSVPRAASAMAFGPLHTIWIGTGSYREIVRPFEPAGSFADGDVAAVQVRAQHPDVAVQRVVTLGCTAGRGNRGVAARHTAHHSTAADDLDREDPRGDHPGIPGDEVDRTGREQDRRRLACRVAHLTEAVRHHGVVLAEALDVEAHRLRLRGHRSTAEGRIEAGGSELDPPDGSRTGIADGGRVRSAHDADSRTDGDCVRRATA